MKYALKNIKIVTPFRVIEPGVVVISGRKIDALGDVHDVKISPSTKVYDLDGMMLTPGFIDLLVHGGGGYGFADENDVAIQKASEFFFSHGTTGMLASLYSKPIKLLLKDVSRIAGYAEKNKGKTNVLGIHMEGPFINPEMKGAMKEEYLWDPDVAKWEELFSASRGYIKLMTIAPELPGNLDVMRAAANDGVVLSIGHSTAELHDIENAIDNGAAHVTHMFNAMRPFHHRTPGVMVGALLRNELKLELIADSIHVHPAVMRLLYNIKGDGGIILITDAIRASGMPDGDYTFMDQKITVKEKKAFLGDGTLAGSTLTLDRAVKNMVELVGVPLTDAVRMASLNGAKVLACENRKGIIAVGKDADLVVMDSKFDVYMTIYQGTVKYQKENIVKE
jgi:N-acetylglucosamine-6-phosphate deacetylase